MRYSRRCASALLVGMSATALLAAPAGAQTSTPVVVPVISTLAGNGQMGFGGDGGLATAARLFLPGGVAQDIAGNTYVADTLNSRVRRVSTAGVISTVAGTAQFGFSGDGGQATSARLAFPSGVAVDGTGNLYVADTSNNRIRRVAPGGVITTVAGDGSCRERGDDHPALGSSLCMPSGVAVDGGNLYIADTGNNVIRKMAPDGSITTFAGSGRFGRSGDGGPATRARLGLPTGVAVDALHDVLIADTANNRIRKVNPAGVISTLAGSGYGGSSGDGGPATAAHLMHPTGLGVDPLGDVFIADTFNQRVRMVAPGGTISTYAGTGMPGFSGDGGPAIQARLFLPTGSIAATATGVVFADRLNQRVRLVVPGPPPQIPETPFGIALFPISAIVLLGAGYLILRWRRDASFVAG